MKQEDELKQFWSIHSITEEGEVVDDELQSQAVHGMRNLFNFVTRSSSA